MGKEQFINEFLQHQTIKLNAEKFPVMIFNTNKEIKLFNSLFKNTFPETSSRPTPNFLFTKERENYRYFTSYSIKELTTLKDNVFYYRNNDETDYTFEILTLPW